MKIKVTLVAYRTVTVEMEAEEEDIDDIELKKEAIKKARNFGIAPTWAVDEWEVETPITRPEPLST
ncbi:hypothetical protein NIES4101_25100 (plasmid) [Calothrix sp. NIES-4101]|nr:hypothetical protein NIES4101_25100 [Calothrix sp. NIES-4101]